MIYEVEFTEKSYKEWQKLGSNAKEQFKKALEKRRISPHVKSAKLQGGHNIYKIKLREIGYRLVYEVEDEKLVIFIIAIGRRDNKKFYPDALSRH